MPGHAINIHTMSHHHTYKTALAKGHEQGAVNARTRTQHTRECSRERETFVCQREREREREREFCLSKVVQKKKKEGKRVMPAHMRHQRSRLPKKNKKKGQKWNTTGALGVASFESREKKEKKRKKSTTCALGVASFDRFGLEGPQPLHHLFQQLCLC